MKQAQIADAGFINYGWNGVSGRLYGISWDCAWYSNEVPLIAFQLCLFEWTDDADLLTVIRFQFLYFLFAINLSAY